MRWLGFKKIKIARRKLYVSWQPQEAGVANPAVWVKQLKVQLDKFDDFENVIPIADIALPSARADVREHSDATDFMMVWTSEYLNKQREKLKSESSDLWWAITVLQSGGQFALWGAPLEPLDNLRFITFCKVKLMGLARLTWLRTKPFPYDPNKSQEMIDAIESALTRVLEHQFQ